VEIMSGETDDTRPEGPEGPRSEEAGTWRQSASDAQEPGDPRLEEAVNAASQRWLKERFGFEEGEDGRLHLPDGERLLGLGKSADELVRGFFRGFFQKTPEEAVAEAEGRKPPDGPVATEVMVRLLSKLSHTVTDTWRDFVNERAERETPTGKKVVDGEFVVAHGPALLGRMVEALGEAFKGEGRAPEDAGAEFWSELQEELAEQARQADAAEAREAAPHATDATEPGAAPSDDAGEADDAPPGTGGSAGPEAGAPKVEVSVDFGSILRALFTPRG